ncbi:MAG: hypothetical protein K2Q01_08095, partial [Rickettsiales bacterium]|nr:hypothetical protein [Rickettsiales bacterium]
AYQAYVTRQEQAKAAAPDTVVTIDAPDAWMRNAENQAAALPGITDPAARTAAAEAAIAEMDRKGLVNAVKADLFKDGKYVVEQAKSFFGRIFDFLKDNMFTALGLGGGLLAANGLGLGTLGTIALVVGGAGLGAYLGDKEHGFIGRNLFGMKPKPPLGSNVQGVFVPTPGQQVPVNTLDNKTKLTLFTSGTGFGDTAITPIANTPDLANVRNEGNDKQFTVEHERRVITYYGRMVGDKFVAHYTRVGEKGADGKIIEGNVTPLRRVETEGAPVAAGATPNPATLGYSFTTKENGAKVDMNLANSNAVITMTNGLLEKLNTDRVLGPTTSADPTLNTIPAKPKVEVLLQPNSEGLSGAMGGLQTANPNPTVRIRVTDSEQNPANPTFQRTLTGTYNRATKTLTITSREERATGTITTRTLTGTPITLTGVELDANGAISVDTINADQLKAALTSVKDAAPVPPGSHLSDRRGATPAYEEIPDGTEVPAPSFAARPQTSDRTPS